MGSSSMGHMGSGLGTTDIPSGHMVDGCLVLACSRCECEPCLGFILCLHL